jgi:hypothetical protein
MRYKVLTDYQTQYPDPIVMRAGDPLQVGEADADNPAWVWCTGPDGRSGWVPRAYFAWDGAAGRALRDYAATELNVRVGEVLTGGEEESGWVWAANAQGQKGWVPMTHVEPLPREENK